MEICEQALNHVTERIAEKEIEFKQIVTEKTNSGKLEQIFIVVIHIKHLSYITVFRTLVF